jgi:hypothetical protein
LVPRLTAGQLTLDQFMKVRILRGQLTFEGNNMSGFWIILYSDMFISLESKTKEVVGYLYCCSTTNCIVTKVSTQLELEVCPKCGEKVSALAETPKD